MNITEAKIHYNTDVVCKTKKQLINLGYVSICKLPKQLDKEKLLNEAKGIFNSLALYNGSYCAVFVKQEYFNIFILRNLKQQPVANIIIKAQGQNFIDKLIEFLNENKEATFEVVPVLTVRTSISDDDKINFLSLTLENSDFSKRNYGVFKAAGVKRVFQICDLSIKELFKLRKFGEKSLIDLKQQFSDHGLVFEQVPQELIDEAKEKSLKHKH
jgi:hypothetical protein